MKTKQVALEDKITEVEGKITKVEAKIDNKLEEKLQALNIGEGASRIAATPSQSLTTCSGSGGKMTVKPSPFHSKTSWEDYKTQFEIIANINDWHMTEKAG